MAGMGHPASCAIISRFIRKEGTGNCSCRSGSDRREKPDILKSVRMSISSILTHEEMLLQPPVQIRCMPPILFAVFRFDHIDIKHKENKIAAAGFESACSGL